VEELGKYNEDFSPITVPVGENLNAGGIVDIVVNPDDIYGIKLVNNSALNLYPSLFFFDNSDLSICKCFTIEGECY
jgi:hypothetical protein